MLFSLRLIAQQNTSPVIAMDAERTPIANFMTPDSAIEFNDSTIFSAQIQIVVDDTSIINSIEIRFGKSSSEILLLKSFIFDERGSLGDGTTYFRNGYNLTLGLGENFLDIGKFYVEMKLKRSDDTYTQVFTFSR